MRRARWVWRVVRLVRAGVSLARAREVADIGAELDEMFERGELDRSGW